MCAPFSSRITIGFSAKLLQSYRIQFAHPRPRFFDPVGRAIPTIHLQVDICWVVALPYSANTVFDSIRKNESTLMSSTDRDSRRSASIFRGRCYGTADPFDSFYIGNGVLNHAVEIQVIDVGLLRKRLIAYVKEMPPFVFYGRPSSAPDRRALRRAGKSASDSRIVARRRQSVPFSEVQ